MYASCSLLGLYRFCWMLLYLQETSCTYGGLFTYPGASAMGSEYDSNSLSLFLASLFFSIVLFCSTHKNVTTLIEKEQSAKKNILISCYEMTRQRVMFWQHQRVLCPLLLIIYFSRHNSISFGYH